MVKTNSISVSLGDLMHGSKLVIDQAKLIGSKHHSEHDAQLIRRVTTRRRQPNGRHRNHPQLPEEETND